MASRWNVLPHIQHANTTSPPSLDTSRSNPWVTVAVGLVPGVTGRAVRRREGTASGPGVGYDRYDRPVSKTAKVDAGQALGVHRRGL